MPPNCTPGNGRKATFTAQIFYNNKEEKQERERKRHFLATAAAGVIFLHYHCDSVPCFKKKNPKLKQTNKPGNKNVCLSLSEP